MQSKPGWRYTSQLTTTGSCLRIAEGGQQRFSGRVRLPPVDEDDVGQAQGGKVGEVDPEEGPGALVEPSPTFFDRDGPHAVAEARVAAEHGDDGRPVRVEVVDDCPRSLQQKPADEERNANVSYEVDTR